MAMSKVDLGRRPGVRHTDELWDPRLRPVRNGRDWGIQRRRKLPQQVPPLNPSILVAVDFLSQVSRNQHSWR